MSPRSAQTALLALWSLALFAACLTLFSRHQNFPFYYHPDEPGKVEQVLTGRWNFNHPMLLLSTTRLAVGALGTPLEPQAVVETGRSVSAVFTALAVVALSLLAFVWRGWPAALIAGLALGLHHQLYELAHYMKEDAAMLFGLAWSFLAAALYERRPTLARAAFFGVACAFAISGKYLGIVSLAIAAPLFWRTKGAGLAAFAGALLATFALVNLPLLLDLGTFRSSLDREMDFVVHGQRGMTRRVPHAQYWNVFIDNSTPAIWLFLAFFLFARWRERGSLSPAEWAVFVFPFAYALALSFSPKSNDRYFLPATAVFTVLAAFGVVDAARLLFTPGRRPLFLCAGAVLLAAMQFFGWAPGKTGLRNYERAFQEDDLRALVTFLKAELPADAVLAADSRVGLPDPKKKKHAARAILLPQKVLTARYAADIGSEELRKRGAQSVGTPEDLRALGVTHLIVSESDYGKFFLRTLRPQEGEAADFARRKGFYEALFRDRAPLWERKRGTVIYLHPGIRVYALES